MPVRVNDLHEYRLSLLGHSLELAPRMSATRTAFYVGGEWLQPFAVLQGGGLNRAQR